MKVPDSKFFKKVIDTCCFDCNGENSKIKCIFRNKDGSACDLDRRTGKEIKMFIDKIAKSKR